MKIRGWFDILTFLAKISDQTMTASLSLSAGQGDDTAWFRIIFHPQTKFTLHVRVKIWMLCAKSFLVSLLLV